MSLLKHLHCLQYRILVKNLKNGQLKEGKMEMY